MEGGEKTENEPPDTTGGGDKGDEGESDAVEKFEAALPDFVRASYGARFAGGIIVIAVIIALVAGFNYMAASDGIKNQVDEDLAQEAEIHSKSLANWVSEMSTTADAVAAEISAGSDVQNYFESRNFDAEAIHYLDSSGQVIASTSGKSDGLNLPSDTDQPVLLSEGRVGFVSSAGSGKVVVVGNPSKAFSSLSSTEIKVVSGSDTVYSTSNRDLGDVPDDGVERRSENVVAASGVPQTDWKLAAYTPKSSAYSVLGIVSFRFLVSTLAAIITLSVVAGGAGGQTVKYLKIMRSKADELEKGNFDVDLSSNRIDEIGQLSMSLGRMRDSLVETLEEAEEARELAEKRREEAEKAKREAEQLNKHLEQKADDYSEVMRKCADGDLTHRMTVEDEVRSEAMAEIARSFNDMMDEIEMTIHELKEFSTEVAESSQEATANAREIKRASQEVAESVQEISDGSTEQSRNLQEASAEMSNLSENVEQVASSSKQVASTAERAADKGVEGRKAAENAIDQMDTVQEKTQETAEEINELDDQMAKIGEIVEFITDIAEQTNILALNANIEAARAGEAGEGFAVVANEVKDLAEETKEAAEEIEELISNIEEHAEKTVSDVEETQESVEKGVETVEEALEALEEIVDDVEETNRGIQSITEANEEQAESTQEVVQTVDEVASISQEVSSQSENVAAAAEEQTASISEVAQGIGNLSDRAERLDRRLSSFEVSNSDGIRRNDGVDVGRDGDRRSTKPDFDLGSDAEDIVGEADGGDPPEETDDKNS